MKCSSKKKLVSIGFSVVVGGWVANVLAADIRDLAPVRVYPVDLIEDPAPEPLPPLSPDPEQGLEAGSGLRASTYLPSATDFRQEQEIDWSYSHDLKPYRGYGIGGHDGADAPLKVSSLTSSDSWVLGAENWRYKAGDGSDLTLGSYAPRGFVWGGGARLGGIALTRSLTDSAVPEDSWEYGLAVGALNYTDAAASSGALTYGAGASDAVVRYGVDSDLTLETQVQWAPDMVTAGIGGLYTTSWGAWRAGVAKATHDLHQGWRYRVGYDLSMLDDVKLSWLREQRSGGFSDLSSYSGFSADSGRRRNLVSTSIQLGRWGTVSGSYEHITSRASPIKQQFAVGQQFWYSPNLRVSVSARREHLSGDYGLGLQLSVPLR